MQVDNFIFQDYLKDLSLCDDLIEYHKRNDKLPGNTAQGYNPSVKKSTDCLLGDGKVCERYVEELITILNKYIEKFPYSKNPKTSIGFSQPIILQHYLPDEGYYAWHCERLDATIPNVTRHLVFITYLNDVTDEGETEFMYQKLKVVTKKGLTIIWPADWTHTHRGITSKTQEKYIATGWFNFV